MKYDVKFDNKKQLQIALKLDWNLINCYFKLH